MRFTTIRIIIFVKDNYSLKLYTKQIKEFPVSDVFKKKEKKLDPLTPDEDYSSLSSWISGCVLTFSIIKSNLN